MTAADRFFARLEPLAYADAENGDALAHMTGGLMAPLEIGEIARDSDTHIAWGALRDPDACPAELLDWLAVDQGIVLPPSALTEADKRYRIKQAAGRYRGTPRGLVEEIQIILDDSKTVLLGYNNGDEWHYLVGTIDAETPDTAAVERAIEAQNPAFMIGEYVSTSDWSYFVIGPTLVAFRDVDGNYSIGEPEYPDYQHLLDSFSDYQHLLDNDPDL